MSTFFQLYIKVSEDTPSLGGGFPEQQQQQGGGGSAVELTDPHLPTLSQYWLAALRDSAQLSLPAEFASQLPPSGGAFYSPDVADCVRPYYESNWSSLLHAAAIWLQERGFEELATAGGGKERAGTTASLPRPLLSPSGTQDGGRKGGATSPPVLKPAEPRWWNSFHLVLGLAAQSLCLPETLDRPLVVSDCLRALRRLLGSGAAQEVLGGDARVSVEVLSVLHRLLLTSQQPSAHMLALEIAVALGEVLKGACAASATTTSAKGHAPDTDEGAEGDTSSSPPNGGGAGGYSRDVEAKVPVTPESSLEPGRSCTYSLLEVVSCCLLRLLPSLRAVRGGGDTRPRPSAFSDSTHGHAPCREDLVCVSLSLRILAVTPSLCSPEAMPTLLPSALHMFLSTMAYVSSLPSKCLDSLPDLCPSALQSLGRFCAALPLSHDLVGAGLVDVLRSALVSVLGGNRVVGTGVKGQSGVKGQDELEMSDEMRLLVTAILLHVPAPSPALAVCPAPSRLFDGCAALFERCLGASDTKVCVCVCTVFLRMPTLQVVIGVYCEAPLYAKVFRTHILRFRSSVC